jgi:1-phosphofructokinase/tagatose 6-phosphate kinase
MTRTAPASYLVVCLNPVIQRTLVYARLDKGEVNRTAEHRVDAAGKCVDCARVLAQAGKTAVNLTQLGGPTRDWFLDLCAKDGVALRWVESGSEIRFCTTVLDLAEGSATELVEEALPVEAGTGERVLEAFRELLPSCSTVMLSGTKAPGFSSDLMPRLAGLASEAGKRLFLDIKGSDLLGSLVHRPLVVKPNLEELFQTFAPEKAAALREREDHDEGEIRVFLSAVGAEYREKYGTWLVVTRGAKPALFWDGRSLGECPARAIKALNPIGSGDAFNVGLAIALENGADIAEAVAEGARFGALNAERLKPGSII